MMIGCRYTTNVWGPGDSGLLTPEVLSNIAYFERTFPALMVEKDHVRAYVSCFTNGNNNRKCCENKLPRHSGKHCADLCDGSKSSVKKVGKKRDGSYSSCLSDGRTRDVLRKCNHKGITDDQKPAGR